MSSFNPSQATTIIHALACLSSIALYLSPFHYLKTNSSYSTYTILMLMTTCNIFYSIASRNLFFAISSFIGFLCSLYYIKEFIKKLGDINNTKLKLWFTLEVVVVIFSLIFYTFKDSSASIALFGTFLLLSQLMYFISPLFSITTALQSKSPPSLPINILLASTSSTLLWSISSMLRNDIYILIPNIFGALICIVELVVFTSVYKKEQVCYEMVEEESGVELRKGGGDLIYLGEDKGDKR